MNTKTLIQKIKQNYQPFHPETNNNISAWAYYIENALDAEETVRNDKRVFYFEIYTDSQIKYICENIESNQFIPASYSFTAILSEKMDERQIYNIRQAFTPNTYARIMLRDNSAIMTDGENHISGRLQFSYIPVAKYRNNDSFKTLPTFCDATMCWKINASARLSESELIKKLDKIVNDIRNNSSTSLPESPLVSDNLPDEETNKTQVNIYNVGGGNTTLAMYPNGKSLLIDCGIDTYNPKNYLNTIRTIINNICPSIILISHWHLDHYSLFNFINKDNLEWIIVPNTPSMPPSIAITICSLRTKLGKNLVLDLSSVNNWPNNFLQLMGYKNTFLFTGMGQTPNPNSGLSGPPYTDIENETAIIVSIGTSWKKIIIPSDVSYFNWPDKQELKISDGCYFIVPHHGGNVFLTQLSVLNSVKYETIYISTNFCHMLNNHQDYLNKMMSNMFPETPDYKYTIYCPNAHYWCYF